MAATVISVVSPCMVTPSLKIEKPPEKIRWLWLCGLVDKQEFVRIKASKFHQQFHEQSYCSYQFLRYQVTDTYESFRHFCQ